MRKVILLILLTLMIAIVPTGSDALNVTIDLVDSTGTFLANLATLPDATRPIMTINGKTSIPIGGIYSATVAAGTFTFTIATCLPSESKSCSGFAARVFVDDGDTIDNLALTDAKITAAGANPGAATLRIVSQTGVGDLTTIPAGTYPYAVAMDGVFLGAAARSNTLSVSATTNASPSQVGSILAAPSFNLTTFASASFSKQGTSSNTCPTFSDVALFADVVVVEGVGTCSPVLTSETFLTLFPNNTARLPGSINVLGSNVTEANGGLTLLTDLLAALHPAVAAKVLRASLEPSPGILPTTGPITVRGVMNSATTWVVDREGNGESKTRVEITQGGAIKIRAEGLCPTDASGPACTPMNVDVSVFCAESVSGLNFAAALPLNAKGVGEASLNIPNLPCTDPTVLLRDHLSGDWIAAIGVL